MTSSDSESDLNKDSNQNINQIDENDIKDQIKLNEQTFEAKINEQVSLPDNVLPSDSEIDLQEVEKEFDTSTKDNIDKPPVFITSISNSYLVTVQFYESYIPWKNLTDLTAHEFRLENDTLVSNL